MCGIAGIYAYHFAALDVDREELKRMREYMRHRGPDDTGEWYASDHRVGFAHQRLAIIDPGPGGHQPMVSDDGETVVNLNGEIYNHASLRARLEEQGHRFRSGSDTEVVLRLYEDLGPEFVHELRGMFAVMIWDNRRRKLLLARDPYGIKPLYYADDGWTVRAASQVRALLAGGRVSTDPEPAGHAGFFLLGSVPEPFTLYQEIRAVPAGHTVTVSSVGAGTPEEYFSIARAFGETATAGDPQDTVRAALLDSVKHHLVADVEVGLFLSAGIDSGALAGLMRDAGQQRIRTLTLAFDEFRGRPEDESVLAETVARHYDTEHVTRRVTEQEFRDDLPRILAHMDQPSIDGVNTWFVSKAAKEQGLKVALSGLGGDELFSGYPSFSDIPRWVHAVAVPGRIPGLGWAARQVVRALAPKSLSPKAESLVEYGGTWAGAYLLKRGLFMPWELPRVMDPDLAREGLRRLRPLLYIRNAMTPDPGTAYARVAALESSLYLRNQLLRDTDWASMAHSVEIRPPLVDVQLLSRVAPFAPGDKRHLAQAPSRRLPDAVVDRQKTGFTTPVGNWLGHVPELGAWQRVPSLKQTGCHWSRRLAVDIHAHVH